MYNNIYIYKIFIRAAFFFSSQPCGWVTTLQLLYRNSRHLIYQVKTAEGERWTPVSNIFFFFWHGEPRSTYSLYRNIPQFSFLLHCLDRLHVCVRACVCVCSYVCVFICTCVCASCIRLVLSSVFASVSTCSFAKLWPSISAKTQ